MGCRCLSVPLVYILPFTHEDASWFARHGDVRRHNQRVLDAVVEQALEDRDIRYTAEAAWIIDDYLSSATARRRREVAALHRRGQLELSAFYGLLDERLAGERARIFNILIGRRILRDQHELAPASVGVFNDIFGQDRQTPQVLRKLGIETILYTRGDPPETRSSIVYRWEAPDGKSWVYAIRQIGYCTGNRLGHGDIEASSTPYRRSLINPPEVRALEAARRLEEYDRLYGSQYRAAGLAVYGLFNGCDYEPLQDDILAVIADLSRTFPETTFALGRFSDYAAHIQALSPASLTTYRGDLFGNGAAPLRGADATNIPHIKVPYELMDRLLYEAEALWAFAAGRTPMPDARPYLTDAWRKALIVATHDAICGTVAETVVQEIAQDIRQAQLMAGRIRKEAMGYLATGLEMRYNDNELIDDAYSILNLSSHARKELVFLPLPPQLKNTPSPTAQLDGEPVPVQIVDGRAAVLVEVEGFSSRQVTLAPSPPSPLSLKGRGGAVSPPPAEGEGTGERWLQISAHRGAITLTNKQEPEKSVTFSFDLFRDRGDTYTVEPLEQQPWSSKDDESLSTEVRVIEQGPVLTELQVDMVAQLPERLDGTRQALSSLRKPIALSTRVRLVAGLDRVDLDVTIDNPEVRDYVLRAVVQVQNPDALVRARDNFFMREHQALDPAGMSWFRRLTDHEFTADMVSAGKIALFAKGLHAYNAEQRGSRTEIALILQRGVSYISRDDLMARPGTAAAQVEAPSAQCLGRHTVRLGLMLAAQPRSANELARLADDFRYSLVLGPKGVDLAGVPRVSGDVVVTGIKEAEDRQGIIYHLVNYGGNEVEAVFDRRAEPCLLDETPDAENPETTTSLSFHPHEIAAVRFI